MSVIATLSANAATSATTNTAHYMTRTPSIVENLSAYNSVNYTHANNSYPESEELLPQRSEGKDVHQSTTKSLHKTSSGEHAGMISGGEYNASLLSKCFYSYVSPLLSTVQQRPLDVNDSFIIPAKKRMESMVPKLESKYYDERSIALSAIRKASGIHKKMSRISLMKQSIKKKDKSLTCNEINGYAVSESIVLGKVSCFTHFLSNTYYFELLHLIPMLISSFLSH